MLGAGVGRNILILWSNAEPSGEMTKFMALTREEGSFFYTGSPDPVDNIATIQWSAPFTGSLRHQIIYKLSALKGGGVLETRSKAYKHGRDRIMVHSIVFPHLSSDSVAAPSQQRCAHHERLTGHCGIGLPLKNN